MKPAHAVCCMPTLAAVVAIWSAGALAVEIQIDLDPDLDRFGSQIEVIQIYEDNDGQRSAFGIYDTGASVITWSAYDQSASIPEIPIKVPDGAQAEGIGGTLTGDVSGPGTITAVSALGLNYADFSVDLSGAAFAPGEPQEHGIQVFVGTYEGSGSLPSIIGTPIHNGRLSSDPGAPNGVAARMNMQTGIDLGQLIYDLLGEDDFGLGELFANLYWPMPGVEFVSPNTLLQAVPDDDSTPDIDESTHTPVRISMSLYGQDNSADPGNTITYSYNPVQNTGVVLSNDGLTIGEDPDQKLSMLFDTGAALSVVSSLMADDLGLDLENPDYWVEVQGAAGSIGQIPGFTIDSLEIPVDDDGNGESDGGVLLTNVPVFVYDITPADADPAEGLDGILGMNLFNTAYEILYNPFDTLGPSVSVTFLNDPYLEDLDWDLVAELEALGLAFTQPAGLIGLPGVRNELVPEPSTWLLLVAGGLPLLVYRLRRRRAV